MKCQATIHNRLVGGIRREARNGRFGIGVPKNETLKFLIEAAEAELRAAHLTN